MSTLTIIFTILQVLSGLAVMVIECDSSVPAEVLDTLRTTDGIVSCTFLDTTEEGN